MKVLVTHASAGRGHTRAAQAVYSYFKGHCRDIDAEIVDILDTTSAFFRLSYSCGYSSLIRYAPFLWQAAFWVTEAAPFRRITRAFASAINRINTRNFARLLIRVNPDFIISTHFLTSEIAASLKQAGKINGRLITVITDFGVHPFWISPGTDQYIVAAPFTKDLLRRQGIEEERIKIFGIPIEEKFRKDGNPEALYAKFGLQKGLFTVIISTGSFGIGPIEEIVASMHDDAQFLVVTANNRELYRRLKNKNYPHVAVFGFIDNIQELMAISDIIICKPGGLTIAEAMAMDLLPVFITKIPGQESENLKALADYGIGVYAASCRRVRDTILDFKLHPGKFREIKLKIAEIKKPFAAREICCVVYQSSAGPGS